MIIGKRLMLKVAETNDDISQLAEWLRDPVFCGPYMDFPMQTSMHELKQRVKHTNLEGEFGCWEYFLMHTIRNFKKSGKHCTYTASKKPVGWVASYMGSPNFGWLEIGYAVRPRSRGKGYATEAVKLLIDYLFLTRENVRVQAVTNVKNVASQRVLEKAGFTREGKVRKAMWNRAGKWADGYMYSIIRDEWEKRPRSMRFSRMMG